MRPVKKSSQRDNRQIVLIALGLFTITFALFYPTVNYSWVNFDDNDYITDNPYVFSGLSWSNIAWSFTHFHAGYWLPLTWISYMLDCSLWGVKAGPQHLVNAFFHALNSALLFWVLKNMTGTVWRCALVAALFAWHPLHVESVAWITERKDVLSTFFWLLAMGFYVHYVQHSSQKSYFLSFVFCVLGTMAKPMLMTFPFVLLLIDLWPLQRLSPPFKQKPVLKLVLQKWPFFLLAALSFGITFFAQKTQGAVSNLDQVPFSIRISNAIISYAGYLFKVAWPADLIAFYPYPSSIPAWKVICAFLFLALLTVLILVQIKRRPWLTVGWFWYLGTLVPVIGLLQVGSQAMADRFTYIPMVGIFIMLAWGLCEFSERWGKVPVFFVVFPSLMVCAILSLDQMKQWQNGKTLFTRILAVAGPVPIAHNNLGAILFQEGQFEEASAHFEEAVRLSPKYADAESNLGSVWFRMGRKEAGMDHLKRAVFLDPAYARAYNNYGNALLQTGQTREAIIQYEKALALRPAYVSVLNNLGAAYLDLGMKKEAEARLREALRLQPDFDQAQKNLEQTLAP